MAKDKNEFEEYIQSKNVTKKKFHLFLSLIMLVSLVAIIWSSYNIVVWYFENKKSSEMIEDIRSSISFEETVIIDDETVTIDGEPQKERKAVDFSELLEKNPDTVGWIKVNNSQIDYPVVQSTDNSFYLNRSFDKSYNSAGWIFADYRNKFDGTDKNIVLYGHHRKDGSMFGTVKNALDTSWCENENNQIITFYTPTGTLHYQIFSSYKVPAENYYTTIGFSNTLEYINFLKELERRSVYNYNVALDENLSIITFSTCGATSKHRFVIHAQLIEE